MTRAGMPFTIEMLMTIAAGGALVIGEPEEAALVVFLFAVGELLEGVSAGKARDSIRALSKLVPKTARLEVGGRRGRSRPRRSKWARLCRSDPETVCPATAR